MRRTPYINDVSRLSEPRLAEPPRLFRILWALVWPIRLYVRHAPFRRGKGRLASLLVPLFPIAPAGFIADLGNGGRAALYYREAIGQTVLLYGEFEGTEIRHLASYAQRGTVAIDVGAKVGVFTIPLANAVADGLVLAFEPHPDNVRRLTSNIERSKLSNVEGVQAAVGDFEGTIDLRLTPDPAFHSTLNSERTESGQKVLAIRQTQIDVVWHRLGRPVVSVIKINVEGAEIPALRGYEQVLAACGLVLLIEAATDETFVRLAEWLKPRGYSPSQSTGFAPWNFLSSDPLVSCR